ncbi:MAG: hypothetical protein KO217_00700 [Methanobacteriaceae archaeon]|jgi:hypothetical protein|nr:MAG: hypothetical protein CIT01_07575 [Methanobacterium sp. BRmetb2]MCC7557187.1 hypothetical protein [Methanobacteriaceae archaeon]
MKYEMRLPPGVTERSVAAVVGEFELELKQTDYGPVLYGEKEELEKARDYIVKDINERLKELESRKK